MIQLSDVIEDGLDLQTDRAAVLATGGGEQQRCIVLARSVRDERAEVLVEQHGGVLVLEDGRQLLDVTDGCTDRGAGSRATTAAAAAAVRLLTIAALLRGLLLLSFA